LPEIEGMEEAGLKQDPLPKKNKTTKDQLIGYQISAYV